MKARVNGTPLRWWGWRAFGALLIFAGIGLWAARAGRLSERGYHLLYRAVALPGEAAGKGSATAALYYYVHCGSAANASRLSDFFHDRAGPGVEKVTYTCREPGTAASKWLRR